MYNPKEINDMNNKKENETIMTLGIVIFIITTFFALDIEIYFSLKRQKDREFFKNAKFSSDSNELPNLFETFKSSKNGWFINFYCRYFLLLSIFKHFLIKSLTSSDTPFNLSNSKINLTKDIFLLISSSFSLEN